MGEGRYVIGGHVFDASPPAPGLYIVATPIGHLKDISLRALEVLAGVDVIACEDSRVTGRLLAHYGIQAKKLVRYDEVKGSKARPQLLKALANGARIALVSDAGTPLISDPGFKMVGEAKALGIEVIPLPGASSILAALTASGLPTDCFSFFGFFPAKRNARCALFERLKGREETLIFFERMSRLPQRLSELSEHFAARSLVIGRELTKLYEEVLVGTADELLQILQARDKLRGEAVILIEGMREEGVQLDIDLMLKDAMDIMPFKDAVKHVVALSGMSRNEVYKAALAIKQNQESH